MIDLCFLITAAKAKRFNPIAELVKPIGIPANKAKQENETQPLTIATKIKNGHSNSKPYTYFCASHS